jgi:hypothetical protein
MLHALLEHLFPVLLQRPVPATTSAALAEAISGQQQPDRHEVLTEVLREEEREREEREPPIIGADPADVRRIEAEQESHRARIRDMEELVKQLTARATVAPEPVAVTSENAASILVTPTKPRGRAMLIAGVGVALLAGAVAIYLANRPGPVAAVKSDVLAADSSLTTVLILPFVVMQDDPNHGGEPALRGDAGRSEPEPPFRAGHREPPQHAHRRRTPYHARAYRRHAHGGGTF